jgi:hypothetical protein
MDDEPVPAHPRHFEFEFSTGSCLKKSGQTVILFHKEGNKGKSPGIHP